MERKNKEPLLYIEYHENGEFAKKGPYFSAEFDGHNGTESVYYIVYDANFKHERISVPWYHTLSAMV